MTAKDLKDTEAAIERAQVYFAAHPRSPSAVRRPKLSVRSGTWMAILGPNIEEGIVGIGTTVEEALHAFDAQYLAALRPPNEKCQPAPTLNQSPNNRRGSAGIAGNLA